MIAEAMPLYSTGHLLHEATLPRHAVKAALPNRNKHREAAKMRRQRNMAQIKEQIKTPEKDINEIEISNLSDAEFKILVIRMLKELSEEDLNRIKRSSQKLWILNFKCI